MKNKIAIIGAGNLGLALARGLVNSKHYQASDIFFTKNSNKHVDDIAKEGFGISTQNADALEFCDTIVIAVLPQNINDVLSEIEPLVTKDKTIISLVTGITIAQISEQLHQKGKVFRVMPNTAISIRESMTCIAQSSEGVADLMKVREIFDLVGETILIKEIQMTSATALCACGIAFFLRSIRAASQGGIEVDFHAEEALKMAAQTAKGAASLLLHNNTHPEDEIDRVTSPKGCTIAGLNQMEHNGFSSSFIKGIVTSAQKAGGLYSENN